MQLEGFWGIAAAIMLLLSPIAMLLFVFWSKRIDSAKRDKLRANAERIAAKLNATFLSECILSDAVMREFDLLNLRKEVVIENAINLPQEGNERHVVGTFRYSKISGEGSTDSFVQTVILFSDMTGCRHYRTEHISSKRKRPFLLKRLTDPASKFDGQALDTILNRDWDVELSGSHCLIYCFDKCVPCDEYSELMKDAKAVWEALANNREEKASGAKD